jgi:hypothetical protein
MIRCGVAYLPQEEAILGLLLFQDEPNLFPGMTKYPAVLERIKHQDYHVVVHS